MYLVFGVILVLLQFTFGYANIKLLITNETEPTVSTTQAASYENSAKKFKRWIDHRIINGTEASEGQFPGEISLRLVNPEKHICGGSIISERWILTAAHCVVIDGHKRHEKEIMIAAGELFISSLTAVKEKRSISKIIPHPEYYADPTGAAQNDIALLELSKPLEFSTKIKPRLLVDHIVDKGIICKIAGWGVEKPKDRLPSLRLLWVEVPILNIDTCRTWMRPFVSHIPEGTICAGYEEGQKDACQGDSGGGLMCDNRLTGVVSWGRGCADPKSPGFYADVYFYSNWINENAVSTSDPDDGNTCYSSFCLWLLVLSFLLCN